MEIIVVGLNHKTAPVALREKFSFSGRKAAEAMTTLETREIFNERVLLSTCNRTEIYGVGNGDVARSVEQTKRFFSDHARISRGMFEESLYVLRQPDSVRHLFEVVSGLNSMVLGETEITGQVKDAYRDALKGSQTGKVLNNLFQKSFKVAKEVRTRTQLGAGRVSVASIAVELAEKIFEELKEARVMVLGTGQMALGVMKALVSRGARPLIVSSHRLDRAEALAARYAGEAVSYERFEERIADIDIFITSTLAPLVLVKSDQVKRWMKKRQERPLFMIDIALPRNIEPAIEQIDNVYLYNIDDLDAIAKKNMAHRERHLSQGHSLIYSQTQRFMQWLTRECK